MTQLVKHLWWLSLLGGCTFSPAGLSDASPPDLGGSSAVAAGDSLPTGAVSFFKGKACPSGWSAFGQAQGRAVVPTPSAADAGGTPGAVGEPLANGEVRTHGHAVEAQLAIGETSFAGIGGCCNKGPAGAGMVAFSGSSTSDGAAVPYVQLLMCKKDAPPIDAKLPAGTLVFVAGATCPAGWYQPISTQGRHLVGLPTGGARATIFGGPPLAAGEERGHTHQVTGEVTMSAHGIALGSGCCAGGYAQANAVRYDVPSSSASVGMPYLNLVQCEKN
jgi:hypothetical protein